MGTKAYAVQNLVVGKIIAGKLREARRALDRYYFSGVSREFDGLLDDDAKRALKDITTYFDVDNPITTVRNEAAFHYGGENILSTLSKVPDDHQLIFFAGEESGNSLYYVAEEIMTIALLDGLPGGDAHAAFDKLIADVQVVARAFTEFLERFLLAALLKVKPDLSTEEVVVDAADVGKLDHQAIRYFLEK